MTAKTPVRRRGYAAFYLLTLTFAGFSAPAWADKEGDALLKKSRDAVQALTSLSCLITVQGEEAKVADAKDAKDAKPETKADAKKDGKTAPPENYRVQLRLKNPDRAMLLYMDAGKAFRAVAAPEGWQIVPVRGVTGKTDSLVKGRAAVIEALRECRLETSVLRDLLLNDSLPGKGESVTVTGNGVSEGIKVRILSWKRENGATTTLEIGETDFLPRRAIIVGGSAPRTEIYSAVRANPALSDRLFALLPAERVSRAVPAAPRVPIARPNDARAVAGSSAAPTLAGIAPVNVVPHEQSEQTFSFGTVNAAEVAEIVHEFPLKNITAQPLVIRRLAASCGCTSAVAGNAKEKTGATPPAGAVAVLAPGEETRIRVATRTRGLVSSKNFAKSVRVYADGYNQPIATLQMAGELIGTIPPAPVTPKTAPVVKPVAAPPSPANAVVALVTGSVAPDFALTDVDGKTRRLSEIQGKQKTALFFFCGCEKCYEAARAWSGRMATLPTGTRTIIVYTEMEAASARTLAQQAGLNLKSPSLTILLDPKRQVAEDVYHAEPCPRVFALDAARKILAAPTTGAIVPAAEAALRRNP